MITATTRKATVNSPLPAAEPAPTNSAAMRDQQHHRDDGRPAAHHRAYSPNT